ncbi:hypothetical protein AUJ66_00450 [Candidatus Desantisbacteria bacterium CG1_02_38_46]|uniref:Uncharacterized protein n=1 Tax=Candidatus Desantisbacteria bacterium CG1_02_38_46 TaxID=1817893 RepID=A0A1J4SGZ6_9BACT|nr:MAG: hypothetical protein AUJ66_00450 [Candidatus Desantisbacteria bacterium CG1_02_38_46]
MEKKRKILIAISVICSSCIAAYLIYNLAGGGPRAYLRKADALLKEKRYEEAINFYNLALEKKPKFPEALIGIGSAIDAIGRPREAINYFDEAIEINPGLAKAWNYKGSALYSLGKLNESLQCYEEALRIDPKYGSPWANKASILRVLKKYDEAKICLDNYIRLKANRLKFEITVLSIEETIKRISPLIERVTGLHYKKEVKVKFIAPHEMEELAKRDLLRQSLSELYSAVIFTRYDVTDKILYIVPDNFQMDIVLLKIGKSRIKPLLDLLVGHELVHALQDQHFNIGTKMLTIKDVEEKQIFDCIMEGHAVSTIEQVSEKMGLSKDIARLSARVSAGDFRENSPFDRMATQYVTSLFNQTYLKGAAFVRFIHAKEGNQGIARLFNNLPKKLSIVVRPQTYYEKLPKEIDYSKVFGVIENVIPDTGWQKHGMPLQEISLRSGLSAWVSSKKLEEALAGFEEGFLLTFMKGGESLISAAIIRFGSNKETDNFFEVNNGSVKSQWNMIKRSPGMSITILQNKKFSILLARKAIIKEAEIMRSSGQKMHTLNIIAAFENFIIDISFINCKIDEAGTHEVGAKKVISRILEKLNQELKEKKGIRS